ncbi:MAG: hypothetical protein FJ278_00100, partial [Planctomycetes bacterium]|nr:hypothetical protein [Planctomycetota bacterium]
MRGLPAGFLTVSAPSGTLLVKDGLSEPVAGLPKGILKGEPPEAETSQATALMGRGFVAVVPMRAEGEQVVIRHYAHGGLWRKVAGDVLLGTRRPVRELVVAEAARLGGVPTAEALAAVVTKWFGPFYRANLISRYIPDTTDLIAFLSGSLEGEVGGHSPPCMGVARTRAGIRAAAAAVAAMHRACILHADLQLKNILVRFRPDGAAEAFVIDFDKSRVLPRLTVKQRMANLMRLDRSATK